MAKIPDTIEIKVVPDTAEAERKLAQMAIILKTLESRTERLEQRLEKANTLLSRKETDKRG